MSLKKIAVVTTWLLCLLATHTCMHAVDALPYTEIDVDTAYQMITSGAYPDLAVLDVRTRDEFDEGHIRGALLIPHTELEERIDELAEHKYHEIIVYCLRGGRSAIACDILDSYGFTKVYNMLGGIEAWMAEGYPVTTSYSTETFFNIKPNPAKAGQTVFLRGILIDQFSCAITNETVNLYYRTRHTKWRLTASLITNDYGVFVADGEIQESAIYQLGVYYQGSAAYEPSYQLEILIVYP